MNSHVRFAYYLLFKSLSYIALLHIDGLTNPNARTMVTMLSSSLAFGVGKGLLIKRFSKFDQAKILQYNQLP